MDFINSLIHNGTGYLEVILGPMFSGKTSRIIELYKQFKYSNMNVIVVNHSDDDRYDNVLLSNHDNIMIECYKCANLKQILTSHKTILGHTNTVVLINEGQFFDDLFETVDILVNKMNKYVFVCGLDGDYRMQQFGQMLDLIPICDKVTKLHSICSVCKNGNRAGFTIRKTMDAEQKLIGCNDIYQPVCRKCYFNFKIEKVSDIHSENLANTFG